MPSGEFWLVCALGNLGFLASVIWDKSIVVLNLLWLVFCCRGGYSKGVWLKISFMLSKSGFDFRDSRLNGVFSFRALGVPAF